MNRSRAMGDLPHLFHHGRFALSGGQTSDYKIDCDALTKEDWFTLAKLTASKMVYRVAVGIPTGGVKFANALNDTEHRDGALLLVDDVFTTGKSMEIARKQLEGRTALIMGAVVFARSPTPTWIKPLFQANF